MIRIPTKETSKKIKEVGMVIFSRGPYFKPPIASNGDPGDKYNGYDHLPLQGAPRFLVAEFAKIPTAKPRQIGRFCIFRYGVLRDFSSGICEKFRPLKPGKSEDFASSATVCSAIFSSGICKKFRPRSLGAQGSEPENQTSTQISYSSHDNVILEIQYPYLRNTIPDIPPPARKFPVAMR